MPSQKTMAFVGWNSSYFVNVPEIDLEHQEIVVLLNKLYVAMAGGDVLPVQSEILHRLVQYTKGHLAHEERMMAECEYPQLEAHRLEHMYLTSQVNLAVERVTSGESLVTIGLLRFLKDWLLNHIGESDRQIGVYLRSRRAA